jgi:hypothetical protein
MEKMTYDKSKWGKGPWNKEPDRVDFIHAGFSCFILRNTSGNWCGYVGVPSTHPAYEKDYDNVNVSVHGGLTYANKCNGHICHVPEPGMPDDVWWLGFDTAHYDDLSPSIPHLKGYGATYKDVNYTRKETEQLAEQLSKM